MKMLALATLALAAACSAPQYSKRTSPVPPPPPLPAQAPAEPMAPADEEATRAWLDEAIERAPRVEPPEPIVQVVERPVYVYDRRDRYYGGYGRRGYYSYDPYRGHYRPRSTFPLNTALGAGIGAIIGHQDGHRGEGALIGGSIGFLLDTVPW